jgi:hypothetical protein
MKTAGVRIGVQGSVSRGEQRFAIAGLFLALAAAVAAPLLYRAVEGVSDVPMEVALVALGCIVALGFLSVGFALGRHVEPAVEAACREASSSVTQRRAWEEQLGREVSRATRAKMPLSLLLVGCAAPDTPKPSVSAGRGAVKPIDAPTNATREAALAVVGDVLVMTCRSRDLVARLGRDGFAVLLPRTSASEARAAADRIRATVAERRRSVGPALAEAVTLAIGISDLASLDQPHPTLLFHAADRALRTAKNAGRDHVEIGNGRTPPRSSSTVIVLDPRRRARKRSSHRTSS